MTTRAEAIRDAGRIARAGWDETWQNAASGGLRAAAAHIHHEGHALTEAQIERRLRRIQAEDRAATAA